MRIFPMLVLNVTPDSFSDGGIHLNKANLCRSLRDIPANSVTLDLGAESTAPFNTKVASKTEVKRFQFLFEQMEQFPELFRRAKTISIDTYKTEVFKEVASQIATMLPGMKVIWNDVSGDLRGVLDVLRSFPSVDYVYCYNRHTNRDFTQNHMDSADKTVDIGLGCENAFKLALTELNEVANRVILDPCYGFAKTWSQNWDLIEAFPRLVKTFPNNDFLFGVSRKSFLRRGPGRKLDDGDNRLFSELQQVRLLNWLSSVVSDSKTVYVRTHDLSLIMPFAPETIRAT